MSGLIAMSLHIAFLSVHDPTDVSKWSGIPFYMSRGFQQIGLRVSLLGPLRWHWSKLYDWKWKIYKRLGKNYSHECEPKVLKTFGRQGSELLARLDPAPDAIVCTGSWPLAFLKTEKPVILWSDGTFGGLEIRPFAPAFCGEGVAQKRRGDRHVGRREAERGRLGCHH